MRIRLPNNWTPRPYQRPAWDYLERGGRHAELIWHRRSGKDEVALHRTAVAAFERVAGYWHMLPEAGQARKAIWDAINPHTGRRRIDEAFPLELRATTRNQEMQIVFKNGSTWQVVGSDNFNSLVGSSPAGIVYQQAQQQAEQRQSQNQGLTPQQALAFMQSMNQAPKGQNTFVSPLSLLAQGLMAYQMGNSMQKPGLQAQQFPAPVSTATPTPVNPSYDAWDIN